MKKQKTIAEMTFEEFEKFYVPSKGQTILYESGYFVIKDIAERYVMFEHFKKDPGEPEKSLGIQWAFRSEWPRIVYNCCKFNTIHGEDPQTFYGNYQAIDLDYNNTIRIGDENNGNKKKNSRGK